MPVEPRGPSLACVLVARFLRTNNYTETLEAFIREAGLPANAGNVEGKENGQIPWTIEGVLDEKKAFDQSVGFERYGDQEKENNNWSTPAPSNPNIINTPSSSNLLACSVESWQRPGDGETSPGSYIVATGADKQLHLFNTTAGNDLATSFQGLSEAPVLSYAPVLNGEYVLLTNMSGQILLQQGTEILDRRKDHIKYAVKVIAYEDADDSPQTSSTKSVWIATAGWDSKIYIYRLSIPNAGSQSTPISIGEPVASITLQSNPESMVFVRHPESNDLILLASRRDSTHLFYYQVQQPTSTTPYECKLVGKQNLAPHSNAWVAFSPSSLALSPHDPTLLAVATSTQPHMKVIIVRLLFPSPDSLSLETSGPVEASSSEPLTQATQALAALALQNREDAAILIQANTLAAQTTYSTPQVVWRPDGSGVWVNGDDGVIRGLEARTGKIVSLLRGGHEAGCKVRAIWAGWVDVRKDGDVVREEWLVSGGFDKRLVVWKGV